MKKAIVLLCIVVSVLSLTGCEKTPSSQLTPVELSDEVKNTLSELGATPYDYAFYDYQVDDGIQGLILTYYTMSNDHLWVPAGSLTIDRENGFTSKGQLSVRMDHNQTIILNSSERSKTCPIPHPELFDENQQGSYGTSRLGTKDIVPNQEIQLMLRISSAEHELEMPDTDQFLDADMSQYRAAICVTVIFFTTKPIG